MEQIEADSTFMTTSTVESQVPMDETARNPVSVIGSLAEDIRRRGWPSCKWRCV